MRAALFLLGFALTTASPLNLDLKLRYPVLLQDDDPNSSTSLGKIASGEEAVGSQIEDMSSQLNNTMQGISYKLNDSINITSTSGASVLQAEINSKERDLTEIEDRIDILETELYSEYDVCYNFTSCDECTADPNCGWCLSSSACYPGDDSGAFNDECKKFSYETCNSEGCEMYTTCDTCIGFTECGWCLGQATCWNATEADSCEQFYNANIENMNTCPTDAEDSESKSTSNEAYYSENPTNSEDEERLEKEAELQDLREERADLKDEIQVLETEKADIEKEAQEGMDVEIPQIYSPSELDGLEEQVDEQYNREIEDEKEYTKAEAEKSVADVNAHTEASVEKSTETLLNNEAVMKGNLSTEINITKQQNEEIIQQNIVTQDQLYTNQQETTDKLDENTNKIDTVSDKVDLLEDKVEEDIEKEKAAQAEAAKAASASQASAADSASTDATATESTEGEATTEEATTEETATEEAAPEETATEETPAEATALLEKYSSFLPVI